jgi:hypothetical protein
MKAAAVVVMTLVALVAYIPGRGGPPGSIPWWLGTPSRRTG